MPTATGSVVRAMRPDDFAAVTAVVEDWWGGRPVRGLLPRLFFDHFCTTSLVAERGGELAGFLVGFLSPAHPAEAYCHVIGIRPAVRGSGLGRKLYGQFFDLVRADGRHVVRAITAPVNTASIAFHRSLGFELEPGDTEVGGVPVHTRYDLDGGDRVLFVKRL